MYSHLLLNTNLLAATHISNVNINKVLNARNLMCIADIPQMEELKVVSLFSGCGGLDLGVQGGFEVFNGENKKHFAKNPFKVIWANDIYQEATETYKKNIGKHIICKDVADIDIADIPDCDIILGGFPCQDFSISGKQKGFDTERGNLYKQMLRVILAKKPKAFIAENVKNILNPNLIDSERNQPVINTICEDFSNAGYTIKATNLHAPDYGIPQRRDRVFIVGIRNDINSEFQYPKSLHSLMTSEQAIDDLWNRENDLTIPNHNQRSMAKFKPPQRMGNQGNYKIPKNGPSQVMRAEHHMNIQAHYRSLKEDEPENRDFWRRLTVREAARLQTFPDSFKFLGLKSHGYKQLGNAVPPILGWYMGRALAKALSASSK